MREQYVTKVNWLVHLGREDLIDEIADEYERSLAEWRQPQGTGAAELRQHEVELSRPAAELRQPEGELRRAG